MASGKARCVTCRCKAHCSPISPKVYAAVGIRGDTFHDAAIEQARFIVAIHPDPDAPIFTVADLCLEADPQEVLPLLLEALEG